VSIVVFFSCCRSVVVEFLRDGPLEDSEEAQAEGEGSPNFNVGVG